jgi:hydrogenase expression/formation protein HypE
VRIVTGDTKVVRQGQGDKVYINTAGIGETVARPSVKKVRPGDKIILTGPLGDHSLAVMLARGEFGMKSPVRSDCAPLLFLLPSWKMGVRWMRDVTRGGLATVLCELAERLPYPVLIDEESIPLSRSVRGAAELLGIDPLFMACEGNAALVVPGRKCNEILQEIKKDPRGKRAAVVGEIQTRIGKSGELLLRTESGGLRLLEPLTSELLPRIC